MEEAESQKPNNKTQARGKKTKIKTSVDQMIKKKKSGMDDSGDESDGFKIEKKVVKKKSDDVAKKVKKEPKISEDSVETIAVKEQKPTAAKPKPRKISDESEEDLISMGMDDSIIVSPKKKAKVNLLIDFDNYYKESSTA